MVKVNRTYSIEAEWVDKLKEETNASGLINDLLQTYFNRANSKDLKLLKKELDFLENEIDARRRERDRKADIIRSIENQAEENNKLILEQKETEQKTFNLVKWLSQKTKEKTISFDDFRNIKMLENWETLISSVMIGETDLDEVVKLANEKYNNLNKKEDLNNG